MERGLPARDWRTQILAEGNPPADHRQLAGLPSEAAATEVADLQVAVMYRLLPAQTDPKRESGDDGLADGQNLASLTDIHGYCRGTSP